MLDVNLIKERLDANLDKLSSYVAQSQSLNLHKAAVLIALFDYNNETYVILTKRSENLRTHKGEVCFPGGKEDEDEGSVTTALREAHEEIGLNSSHVTVIGTLAPMFTFTKFAVTPVVGVVHGDLDTIKLAVNSDEVSQVFACPLRIFLDSSKESSRDVMVESQNREFHIHYFYHEFHPLSGDVQGDFLSTVLGGEECQYKIFGLTAKFAIATAIICFGRAAVFDDLTYSTDYPQGEHLEKNIVWASRM